MARYIELDAIVAGIEKRKRQNLLNEGAFEEDIDILSLINTLEVKEVDDETECKIFPRPAGCYSTCKECPWSAASNKSQKGE